MKGTPSQKSVSTTEYGNQMDGLLLVLHARLCPEISPESNSVLTTKAFWMRLYSNLSKLCSIN